MSEFPKRLEETLNRAIVALDQRVKRLEEASNVTLKFISDILIVIYRVSWSLGRTVTALARLFVHFVVLVLAFAFVGSAGYQLIATNQGGWAMLALIPMVIGWGSPVLLCIFLVWSYWEHEPQMKKSEDVESSTPLQSDPTPSMQILHKGFYYLLGFDFLCATFVCMVVLGFGYRRFILPPLSSVQSLAQWIQSFVL